MFEESDLFSGGFKRLFDAKISMVEDFISTYNHQLDIKFGHLHRGEDGTSSVSSKATNIIVEGRESTKNYKRMKTGESSSPKHSDGDERK